MKAEILDVKYFVVLRLKDFGDAEIVHSRHNDKLSAQRNCLPGYRVEQMTAKEINAMVKP